MTASTANTQSTPSPTVDSLLKEWDEVIRARSRFHARRARLKASEDDFAQNARIRLLKAFEAGKALDAPYVQRVIDNSIRTSIRREGQRLRPLSPRRALSRDAEALAAEMRDPLDVDERTDEDALRAEVEAWLATLEGGDRRLAELAWRDGETERGIASQLDVSQTTVNNRKTRLIHSLREWLRGRGMI